MCYYINLERSAQQLAKRFKAGYIRISDFEPQAVINGFSHPKLPVLLGNEPDVLQDAEWGLLPTWAKDTSFQKNTLNARTDTMREKPSFKDYLSNRCLIPATGFFEWQWLDETGKEKQKYFIKPEEQEIFAFAGIWSPWINPQTGEKKITCTILTTQADDIMSVIHNSKQRMPVILSPENEELWLHRKKIVSNVVKLVAEKR